MSINAMSWAKKQRAPNIAQTCVLFALADYADKDGHSYPGVIKLAQECNCSESTLRRHLRGLEKLGLVRRTTRYTRGGRQTSNAYDLVMVGEGEGVKLQGLQNLVPSNVDRVTLSTLTPSTLSTLTPPELPEEQLNERARARTAPPGGLESEWQRLLSCLARKIGERDARCWFSKSRAVSITDQEVVIEVSSKSFRDHIHNNFRTVFYDAIGLDLSVTVAAPSTKQAAGS